MTGFDFVYFVYFVVYLRALFRISINRFITSYRLPVACGVPKASCSLW